MPSAGSPLRMKGLRVLKVLPPAPASSMKLPPLGAAGLT